MKPNLNWISLFIRTNHTLKEMEEGLRVFLHFLLSYTPTPPLLLKTKVQEPPVTTLGAGTVQSTEIEDAGRTRPLRKGPTFEVADPNWRDPSGSSEGVLRT